MVKSTPRPRKEFIFLQGRQLINKERGMSRALRCCRSSRVLQSNKKVQGGPVGWQLDTWGGCSRKGPHQVGESNTRAFTERDTLIP